jgi:hypothetical protein
MAFNVGGNNITYNHINYYNNLNIVRDSLLTYVDAGIIASYSGSGTTWTDISNNSKNGTLTNGPTFVTGSGGAIVLDGSDDTIEFGSSFSINTFSICVWVNAGSTQGVYADILDNNHRGGTSYVCQQDYTNTNQFGFGVGDGSAGSSTSVFTLTANTWYFLTFTFQNQTKGYINGTLFSTGAVCGNPVYTGIESFRLGGWGGGGRNFNGKYGSMIFYTRALSATEVLQNFNATRTRFGI